MQVLFFLIIFSTFSLNTKAMVVSSVQKDNQAIVYTFGDLPKEIIEKTVLCIMPQKLSFTMFLIHNFTLNIEKKGKITPFANNKNTLETHEIVKKFMHDFLCMILVNKHMYKSLLLMRERIDHLLNRKISLNRFSENIAQTCINLVKIKKIISVNSNEKDNMLFICTGFIDVYSSQNKLYLNAVPCIAFKMQIINMCFSSIDTIFDKHICRVKKIINEDLESFHSGKLLECNDLNRMYVLLLQENQFNQKEVTKLNDFMKIYNEIQVSNKENINVMAFENKAGTSKKIFYYLPIFNKEQKIIPLKLITNVIND